MTQKAFLKGCSAKQYITLALLPAFMIYFEIVMRAVTRQKSMDWNGVVIMIFSSLATGIFFDIILSITRRPILTGIIGAVILEAIAAFDLIEFFTYRGISLFITLKTILSGANGIATEDGEGMTTMFRQSWYVFLLFHLPVIIYLVLLFVFKVVHFERLRGFDFAGMIILVVAAEALALLPSFLIKNNMNKLTVSYDFDTVTKECSLQSASKLDLVYMVFGNPFKLNFDLEGSSVAELDPDTDYNMINIDLEALDESSENENIKEINSYIKTLTPGIKNEYTGIFKGKNLIQITAESFVGYVVDPDLTPILYRLSSQGIQFTDYYQPLWSGSTTTGEFQIMTGLIPYDGYDSMYNTRNNYMPFALGNQSLKAGYTTYAFHNGTYDFYHRYLTHVNLGYSRFYAIGQGMTGLSNGDAGWPQSDLEMMEFAIPDYIHEKPFNIYMMTVSGHNTYTLDNFVAAKNYDEVKAWAEKKEKDYSETTLCYLACNLELEKALEYLFDQLQEEGLLDDTVIGLTGDHYPYALTDAVLKDIAGNIVEDDKTRVNIAELFGFEPETMQDYNHGALYIWSKELEDSSDKITVTSPVSSVDILPTLSNLFGFEFDTRLLAGRDALDDSAQPLVVFSNYSWLTEVGFYDITSDKLTLKDGTEADDSYDEYISKINKLVKNRIVLSQKIVTWDYYKVIAGQE